MTVLIKNINSLLNKLTNENYITINHEILKLVKSHIMTYIIENIINKSLLHHIYIKLYVKLLNMINKKFNINILLNKELETIYTSLMKEKNDVSTYEGLCNKNNKFLFSLLLI